MQLDKQAEVQLRPYQETLIADIRASLARHRHTLAVLPTGGGKTKLAAKMAKGAHAKKKRIMFTCHRDFLLDQTAEEFDNIGLHYTHVASGRIFNPYALTTLASIDTLKRRLDSVPVPDILIVDEAVHSAAAGWAKVLEYYQSQGCFTIGLTACPERLSGQGLNTWFRDMVQGPSTAVLMEMGYLSKYKAYAPTKVDLSGVHSRGGDYIAGEINNRMDKPSITGDAVKEYRKIAAGRQGLMFCCSIQHSQNVVAAFREAGYESAHIGADTDQATRREMLRDYRHGKLKILSSVDIFNEGFNVPAASYAGLLRPTKSLSIYLQQCGRVFRIEDGKEYAFISDHANNIALHGLPDEPRVWSLAGREKKDGGERTIPVRSCPECFFSHRPSACCPNCNYEYPVMSREVEEIDGELSEIDQVAKRKELNKEVGMAKSLDDLIAIGYQRGYKNPGFWAKKIFQAREARR